MSEHEPPRPPRQSMLGRIGWALREQLVKPDVGPRPYDAVKLVHADDLTRWDRFPRWQDFDGISYGEYREQARRLELRRRTVARLIAAEAELARIDGDHLVEYATRVVDVPRSLRRRTVRIELPEAPRAGARVESSDGAVRDGRLEVQAGWGSRSAVLTYRGPSRDAHAARIAELEALLATVTAEERATIEDVATSRFAQPVVFVSHRWEDEAHPDPSGEQLGRLRTLEDCFLIYDYASFPQAPLTAQDEAELRRILEAMDALVKNVVVLATGDYLTRGWCLYEYVVASLRGSTVCDELADPRFERLRDWASTPPPVTMAIRNSFEAQQQNYLNERILECVNEVLPLYREAAFTVPGDRELVTRLLVEHLKRTLPTRKECQVGLGEWTDLPWTDDDLLPFFAGEARFPSEEWLGLARFETDVPSRLHDAVEAGYAIKRFDRSTLLDPTSSLSRARL